MLNCFAVMVVLLQKEELRKRVLSMPLVTSTALAMSEPQQIM
jgi:hypothetical protein